MLSSCCWRSEAIPSQIFTKVQTFFENSARHRQKISFCHYFLSRGPISWRVGGDGKTMRLRRYTGLAGDRVAGGDYILFLFCHAGGFGACGATYCLWLLMGYGKQCACGATRGWRGDRVAGGDYIFFLFCHPGGFGAYGATYCLWLLMGKQCACGATQGRREANGAHKGRLHTLFVFFCGWFGDCGAEYCCGIIGVFMFCFSTMSMFSCCRFGFRPRGQLPPGGAGFSGWVRPSV